ncbi:MULTISPECIES: cytochrome o ubiquinol oxidase subunit III [Bombella]|uniref:Cytochrome bo(3) ubiquinol oxidase subunit 3 n=1 Tax=Bombella pollinis TaxID=2967337 RepID=A0ABT3WNS5_9PROT|nr:MULTISPECIES: cytochrome o ubiquinol oxidase subunit III [Bombella]MCX5619800.1 cytochrome o ubiquinol oxidase subunit III [Bombella pollinis]MUG04509.1 cytochrome o ubiquinol oxidase subunit III [Bombella sp. ESL0378]MUG90004.1 cytochrome o ubiquinol oxidase subunit III [Bombella sp. ESL0385]
MSYDTTHASVAHNEEHEHHQQETTIFGFWVYLMTDCIIFGTLFAVFASLCHHFAGGPTGKELFDIKNVEIETAILLLSSITYGFASINAHKKNKGAVLVWLLLTFILGVSFVTLEIKEFHELVAHGAGPDKSAFLSSFFTLVGTHGLHVTIGLIWMFILFFQVMGKQGLSTRMQTKLTCLSLFWHFLDIVWICVFSFVYLGSVV